VSALTRQEHGHRRKSYRVCDLGVVLLAQHCPHQAIIAVVFGRR
jgi:hypothetical protein